MISEEEKALKSAMEELESIANGAVLPELAIVEAKALLNLINKQQKETEREKQYSAFYKDLCAKQQKEIEELKEEKELNERIIYLANNSLISYHEGYQAGLHKEITAVEILIEEKEKFRIGQQIKVLKNTINELHNKLHEGNIRVEKNYISKDKIRELKKSTHNTLDENGITRGYQQIIDKYFDKLLEE